MRRLAVFLCPGVNCGVAPVMLLILCLHQNVGLHSQLSIILTAKTAVPPLSAVAVFLQPNACLSQLPAVASGFFFCWCSSGDGFEAVSIVDSHSEQAAARSTY